MQVEVQTPSKCSLAVSCTSLQVTCSEILHVCTVHQWYQNTFYRSNWCTQL